MDLPPALDPQQQRKTTAIHDSHAERTRRWDAGASQRQVEEAARALPDALFKDRPEVIQATQRARATEHRAERMGAISKQAVSQVVQNLEAEVQAAADAVQLAAIDDMIADDQEFPLALAAMERQDQAQQRLQAARMASEVLGKVPVSIAQYWEQARRAKSARLDLLLRLKREHLQAHPELLQEPPASA